MNTGRFSKVLLTQIILLAATQSYGFAQTSSSPQNWSGPNFGVYFGSGKGNTNTSFSTRSYTHVAAEDIGSITQVTTTIQSSGNPSGNVTGSMANLFVGYNFQPMCYSRIVLGGQLEGVFYSDLILTSKGSKHSTEVITTDDGVTNSISNTTSNETYTLEDKLTSYFTFLARGGYLVSPNLLLYVLAGGVEGNFSFPSNADLVAENRSTWSLGYTLGAGLEYQINDNWSVRGEYRYIDFNNINRNSSTHSSSISDPDGPNNTTTSIASGSRNISTDMNFNLGTIGVVYRFS